MKLTIWILYFLCVCFAQMSAQTRNYTGAAPSLSVTTSLNKKFDLNILATSKIELQEKTGKQLSYQPQTLEVYVQGLLTYSINQRWHFSGGYGFQRNNPFLGNWRNENRLVQQVIFSIPNKQWMIYHRLRFEERWFSYPEAATNFGTRARYQFGFVHQLHSGKAYWQISEEAYFIPSGKRNAFFSENWLYTGIAFALRHAGHIEIGIGYDSNITPSHNISNLALFQLGWSYMIKAHDKNMMHAVIRNRQF
ncbi:MAG: DUF2490 domain-containing protein [Bacteroidetes bacterium]|nr:DUF2490 domain-containing protein [Bacteroidota bacterium]